MLYDSRDLACCHYSGAIVAPRSAVMSIKKLEAGYTESFRQLITNKPGFGYPSVDWKRL